MREDIGGAEELKLSVEGWRGVLTINGGNFKYAFREHVKLNSDIVKMLEGKVLKE